MVTPVGIITPIIIISPLSFSPVGEMQVTPVLSKTGDAGYSSSVKDWEMQVTPNLISH